MFGLSLFKKKIDPQRKQHVELSQRARVPKPRQIRQKAGTSIKGDHGKITFPADYGYYERITLYRFLRDQIPVVNGAVWTWTRLCSSPMEFHPSIDKTESGASRLRKFVDDLNRRLAPHSFYKSGGIDRLSDLFFSSLFTDGAFAGLLEFNQNDGVTGFRPVDIRKLTFEYETGADQPSTDGLQIYYETESGKLLLDPANFIYIPLDDDSVDPRGRSILQSIGFVSRLEQKLIDDMQKSQEKAGYNRVHVIVRKPERRMGESENDYIDRANNYFDDTVGLFSGIKPADSVVTWDDIELKTVSPAGGGAAVTHSWYLCHRALVEDVCAGVHLDPFMLGYSYGNTQSWAKFKFELVLRQVVSVQRLAVRFFEWLINTHLVLSGCDLKANVNFNNNKIISALERYKSRAEETRSIKELYESGLYTKDEARARILLLEEE